MPLPHEQQRRAWNEEHREPFAVPQMHANKGSSCLIPFYAFLEHQRVHGLKGLEMGCGKGRNVLWLAEQRLIATMDGFDFSEVAIAEAQRRAKGQGLESKTTFGVMDATAPWQYASGSMDFAVDCTASTDIEDPQRRAFAIQEMHRVLKPGGYALVYAMSTDDEYHRMMIGKSPAPEQHAFLHPLTGKFEKVFAEEELDTLYRPFDLVEKRRIAKTAVFFGQSYSCALHWRIYKKERKSIRL